MILGEKKIKLGLRISVVEGVFANVHGTLTSGLFLTGFALYLGANDFQIGLLAAIPAIFASFGFIGAFLITRLEVRKKLTVWTAGIGRGLFFIPVCLMLLKYKIHLGFLLLLIGVFNGLLTICGNAWTSWMSDLVPKEMRGRYFGIRNTIIGLIGMMIAFGGASLLDQFKKMKMIDRGYELVFLIAVIAAGVSTYLLSQQPKVSIRRPRTEWKTLFLAPLRDRNYRRFLYFMGFWSLTGGVAGPFYLVYMLRNLEMSYRQVAVYGIIGGALSLVFGLIWGFAIDKVRSKPVLAINFFVVGFLPILWLFPTKHFLLPVWLDGVGNGVLWSGVNLAVFNIVLSLSDNEEIKESYFAIFAAVTGIGGFVSSILGGFIAHLLINFKLVIFGHTYINYHLLFVFAAVTRFVSLFFLKEVREPKAYPTLYALEVMGDYAVRRLNYGKELILNTLRFLKPRS
jgi:MFS family permease